MLTLSFKVPQDKDLPQGHTMVSSPVTLVVRNRLIFDLEDQGNRVKLTIRRSESKESRRRSGG